MKRGGRRKRGGGRGRESKKDLTGWKFIRSFEIDRHRVAIKNSTRFTSDTFTDVRVSDSNLIEKSATCQIAYVFIFLRSVQILIFSPLLIRVFTFNALHWHFELTHLRGLKGHFTHICVLKERIILTHVYNIYAFLTHTCFNLNV